MKLGLFPNMPEAEYREIPAVNASALKQGRRSLAHMRYAMLNPSEPSPAMALGTAVHMALLEPSRFAKTYAGCAQDCDKRAKAWRDHVLWCEESGRTPLTHDEAAAVSAMVAAVNAHHDAGPLFQKGGENESAVVWQDQDTGLACKAKLDRYLPGVLALDLKTTRNASEKAFRADVGRLSYFMQIAWYREGFERVTGQQTPFTIVAVENEPPYAVAVYSLDDHALACGIAENHRILKEYAKALESGVFPGYPHPNGPIEIGLNKWDASELVPEAMNYDPDDTGGF